MRWMVVLSLLGCLAARADVTGRWNGSARYGEDGKSKEDPISMTLVQRGDTVTGSVRVEDKDLQIAEGRSEDGGRLRFKVNIPNDTIQFDLTIAGDRMTGKVTSAKESDKAVEVDLTRKVLARPALDVTGVWSGMLTGKGESMPINIEIRQSGNEVAGIATSRGRSAPLVGEMDGAKLTFHAEAGSEKVRFALIVTPENMSGFAASEADGKAVVLEAQLTRTAKATGPSGGGVSGQWMGTVEVVEGGTVKHYAMRFRLAVSGSVLTGSVVNEDGNEYPIQHGSVEGNRVEFEMEPKGAHVRFRLTVEGDRLTGESVESLGGSETTMRITAVRRAE